MKRIFLLIFFLSSPAFSTSPTPSNPQNIIEQIDPNINMGIKVVDLNTGTTLFQKNSAKRFIPASNMKLFSDAAALMLLGPDYTFKNRLFLGKSELKNGTLKGSLYLELSGDPSFSAERLSKLLQSLKKWHINVIKGPVYIDSSLASLSPYAPGGVLKDRAYGYGAPIAPVIVDSNRVIVTVNPRERVNQLAIVELSDKSHSMTLTNEVMTRENAKNCGIDFVMNQENHVTVRGCVGVGQAAMMHQMAIQNPLLYAQGLIRQLLKESGIELEGAVLLGKKPSLAMLISSDRSNAINRLLADTLKPSDNLYADSLFLHTANRLKGEPASWEESKELVRQFLQKETGINLNDANLADGSGLSRLDGVTPEQTVRLLGFLFERFPMSYEYIAALPVSGRDGTLAKRFKKPGEQGFLRAKTGTMTGILSLSGYLYTPNAHTLAFAIYINTLPHTKPSVSGKYRYLIDALCKHFLNKSPNNVSTPQIQSAKERVSFQKQLTALEQERKQQAKWRRIESLVKQNLKGQDVTVRYRPNELILEDHQSDRKYVMNALSHLSKQVRFTVALSERELPSSYHEVVLLRREATTFPERVKRIWVLKESD